MSKTQDAAEKAVGTIQYVTVRIAGQLFGVPIEIVHEVFTPDRITRVPMAPAEIEGVLNLRGRIVTMVNMRRLLGLSSTGEAKTAVGIERFGEAFGLIIDEVGEVLVLEGAKREANPANLDPRWAELIVGVHRLANELMLVLNVERALARLGAKRNAA
ncbi:MAG: chemotaxis protein CheW [Rhizobiales bacterium 17-65-6]|nr:MAG: chemotaxis protein CheW [Rhizobiales bacterium 12-68-15]OYX90140.1 MAG: chemotaxis protein CheW [Azorhizobium sp. 32-67-21]OYY12281.1 MAG: chemotaxis protein CheW [Rhizobiales bacterium 35-68-8]OZA01481.1 MAG: chemotaxis protein CheW [Rhizobiales bacterium 17-65-6]OZA90773.1 MAG: chemotaxis protein CheW [Azorhizobium sp. 39-67-5]